MIGQTLKLRGIEKRYGNVRAVEPIDLDIEAGEFVSIVGPSGSGKTTLLTMIAGFEVPTAGTIVVGERDLTMVAPNHRDIGMVFQKYALFPHMTVHKNVGFPLKMRGRSRGSAPGPRVDAALQLVQLSGFEHRYPHQLSGGQQQRVAVARALVFDPPVLLMDEPLGALDKKLREAMQFEIKSIQERLGVTVVYVTHDQEEALTMSDRVAVMNKGRLEQIGRPAELYANPCSPFVADFVGTINFLQGRIVAWDGAISTVRIAERLTMEVPIAHQHGASFACGDAVTVAIRPEHIAIGPEDPTDNQSLGGVLHNLVFAGASTMALITLDGLAGPELRVVAPSGLTLPLERGSRVRLTLSPDKVKIFNNPEAPQS